MTALTDILDEGQVEYRTRGQHHHATSGFLQVDCPHCSPGSGAFRLGISEDGRTTVCWVCGKHPSLITLRELTGLPWSRLKALLGTLGDAYTPSNTPQGTLTLPWGLGSLRAAHRDYLASRRLDPDAAQELWGVQGTAIAPKLPWRLFFPATVRGKILSWTTRSLTDPGYYRTAGPTEEVRPLKDLLLGADRTGHTVLVVEGPLDMLAGGPGTVTTCGAVWTVRQAAALARYPVRVLAFDADAAGRGRAAALARLLAPVPGKTVNLELTTGKDLSRATEWERREVRQRFLEG